MSACNTLEHILREVLEVLKTLQEDWVTRSQFIKELRGVVESVESLRGAAVEPFGSFVSNLFTRWSDMDISINLPKGGYISYVENGRKQSLSKKEKREEKERKIFLLEDLQKAMLGGRWQMVQLIRGSVPILKCKSSHYGFSCDISIDNLESQMKSKLLLWISEIDGRFRDMVLLVKEWAKAHEINDATPISGTFNSYSLCLLVIFHFQTCEPAILPPLKDIYEGNVADDLRGERTVAERHMEEACAANIRRFRQVRRVNHSSLSELFTSFLEKFSNIGFKASNEGIRTYTGKWELRGNTRCLRKTRPILIEDPFDQQENSARAVCKSGLARITKAFEMSSVISASQNEDFLLARLFRPQVSQDIIARAGLRNPASSVGGYHTHLTRPQVYRNVKLQSETQTQFQNLRLESCSYNPIKTETLNMNEQYQSKTWNQFQNLRLESCSNNPNLTGTATAHHHQGQHRWRPKSDR
ncbi:hypothetical protein ACB092_06G200200 [Castanea dentata]